MFRRLLKKNSAVRLGRWSKQKPMTKVDFANSDHCGTCKYQPKNDFDTSFEVSLCALQSMYVYPSKKNKMVYNDSTYLFREIVMHYLPYLKKGRWVRRWVSGETCYGIKIGASTSRGTSVPDLTDFEMTAIADFFLEFGVVENGDGDLWWSKSKFRNQTGEIVEAGIEFTISKDAYNILYNN